jgi:hypothetical protein
MKWCRINLPTLLGKDCGKLLWNLRCGVVHEGGYKGGVVFTTPESGVGIHRTYLVAPDRVILVLDTVAFCRSILHDVRAWYAQKENDPVVKANIGKLVCPRPNYLAPQIRGVMVIG